MAEDDESNNVVLNEYELSNGFRSHSFGNYLSPRLNMTCLLQLSVKKRIVIIKLFDGMDNNSLYHTICNIFDGKNIFNNDYKWYVQLFLKKM